MEPVNSAYTIYDRAGRRAARSTSTTVRRGRASSPATRAVTSTRPPRSGSRPSFHQPRPTSPTRRSTSRSDRTATRRTLGGLPHRHHRHGAAGVRLPVLRRPAAARHRRGQPLHDDRRLLDPRPGVQRRLDLRDLQEGPGQRGRRRRTSPTSAPQDIDGNPLFGVQPAITTGSSPAEFLLNAMDPSGTGDNRIGCGRSPTARWSRRASRPHSRPPNAQRPRPTRSRRRRSRRGRTLDRHR